MGREAKSHCGRPSAGYSLLHSTSSLQYRPFHAPQARLQGQPNNSLRYNRLLCHCYFLLAAHLASATFVSTWGFGGRSYSEDGIGGTLEKKYPA
eukprot:6937144-Pyramimonas_sp.AAC.1